MSWTWQQHDWHAGYRRDDDWQWRDGWHDGYPSSGYATVDQQQWSDPWHQDDGEWQWSGSTSWQDRQDWRQDGEWTQRAWSGSDWNSGSGWSHYGQWDECREQHSWGDCETGTPDAGEPTPSGSERGDQAGAVEESAPSTSNSEGKSGKTREPKTGKEVIPSWDGTTPIRDYKKRIDLFLSTTAIDPEYRAGRLVEQLSGVAWRAVDTMDVTLLRHPEGVQHLLAHLRSELEPVEFLQTFGVLTNFYKKFKRQKGESFIEFDNRYRVQLQKLKEVDAELNDLSKAYWFLETASISEELRKQCISASGGVLQYEKLRTALISIVPSVRRDEDGDFARSTKDVNDKKPITPRVKAHGVNVVAKSDDDFQEIENEPNDDEDDATPPDLEELERQAEVLVTQASKPQS